MKNKPKATVHSFDQVLHQYVRQALSWNMGRLKTGLLFGLPVLILLGVGTYVAIMLPQPAIRFFTGRAADSDIAVWEYLVFWAALIGGGWTLGIALWWRVSRSVLLFLERILRNSKAGVIVNPIYGQIAAGDPTQKADLVWVLDPSNGRTELHVVKFDPVRDSEDLEADEYDELLVATAYRASPTDQKAHTVPRFLCLPANFSYQQYLEFPASNYESRPQDFPGETQRLREFKWRTAKQRGMMSWYTSGRQELSGE